MPVHENTDIPYRDLPRICGVHRYFLSRKHTAPTVHSVPRYVFFVEEDVPYVLNLALRECGTITTRVEI